MVVGGRREEGERVPATQVKNGPRGLAEGRSAHNDYALFRPGTWERGMGWPDSERPTPESLPFFSMHWQVDTPDFGKDDSMNIRLHVESTKYKDLPKLNDLKGEVVQALLDEAVEQAVRQLGYNYRPGPKTSTPEVRKNRTTEAFRVVLSDAQRKPADSENLVAVHGALGHVVEGVLRQVRFSERIDEFF
jgi:hypothetical protein